MSDPASTLRVTLRRLMRVLPRQIAITLLALSVALASGLGGISYTLCVGTGRVHLTTCCPAARRDVAAREAARDAVNRPVRVCCEGHRIDSLPRSQNALGNDLTVMPAALFATLSLEQMFERAAAPSGFHGRRSRHAVRAGPESPLFELNRAYLI